MGSPETAASLFMAPTRPERESLAEAIIRMNQDRRDLVGSSWESIYPLALASHKAHGDKFVVVGGPEVHRGITGLIASRIASTFKTPAVVASFLPDATVVGSIRSARGFPVSSFLEACAELFIDYGGHDSAAGFSLQAERWPELEARALSYAEALELEEIEETIVVDAELPRDYLKPEITELTRRFEPYGEENEPLVFLSRNVPIADAQIVGKKEQNHLKLTLDFGKTKWPALLWDGAQRIERDFSLKNKDKIDLVYKVTINRWNGMEQPQLEVFDARRAESEDLAPG
jgi:single-stranded-DNA-specific exonuclease